MLPLFRQETVCSNASDGLWHVHVECRGIRCVLHMNLTYYLSTYWSQLVRLIFQKQKNSLQLDHFIPCGLSSLSSWLDKITLKVKNFAFPGMKKLVHSECWMVYLCITYSWFEWERFFRRSYLIKNKICFYFLFLFKSKWFAHSFVCYCKCQNLLTL